MTVLLQFLKKMSKLSIFLNKILHKQLSYLVEVELNMTRGLLSHTSGVHIPAATVEKLTGVGNSHSPKITPHLSLFSVPRLFSCDILMEKLLSQSYKTQKCHLIPHFTTSCWRLFQSLQLGGCPPDKEKGLCEFMLISWMMSWLYLHGLWKEIILLQKSKVPYYSSIQSLNPKLWNMAAHYWL